jgi:hypothetical protein
MQPGDRVRLKKQVARRFMRPANRKVDWLHRRGVVQRVSKTSTDQVWIRWDDRPKYADRWPERALIQIGVTLLPHLP